MRPDETTQDMTVNQHSLALAIAVALALAGAAHAATPIESTTRPASAQARVEVHNVRGSVTITAWDKDEVALGGSLGEGSKLEVSGSPDHLIVRVANPDGSSGWSWWGGNRGPREDTVLSLSVPRAAAIEVEVVSADARVEGLAGSREIEVDSVSGDVRVQAQGERFGLQSVSGDIEASGSAQRAHVESVSGDVDASGLDGEITVETVSGRVRATGTGVTRLEAGTVSGDLDFDLGLAPGARIDVETMSGDLTLHVPADVSARIEASTFSGSIRSDIGTVEEEEHGPGSSLKATAGSGQGSINLESFSGDIELRKR